MYMHSQREHSRAVKLSKCLGGNDLNHVDRYVLTYFLPALHTISLGAKCAGDA